MDHGSTGRGLRLIPETAGLEVRRIDVLFSLRPYRTRVVTEESGEECSGIIGHLVPTAVYVRHEEVTFGGRVDPAVGMVTPRFRITAVVETSKMVDRGLLPLHLHEPVFATGKMKDRDLRERAATIT